MNDADVIAVLSSEQVVGLTLYGETSNQPLAGTQAVGSVIGNRVTAQRHAWGLTPRAVCLAPFQFSCWIPAGGAVNYLRVIDAGRMLLRGGSLGPTLRRSLDVAAQLVGGALVDRVDGSTHYMTVALYESDHCPTWAFFDDNRAKGKRPPTCRVGDHAFFRGVK